MKAPRAAIPEPYALRIKGLRESLAGRRLDGYFVQDRMDQYWLTGFTGEDGGVLVTPKSVTLITDGRFDEAADHEAPYARKFLRKKRTPDMTAKAFTRARLGRLGFNPDHMTVREHSAYRKLLRPTKLVASDGLIGPLRAAKDATEVERIRAAIRVAEQAFEEVRRWLKPGTTEREIAARLVYEMQRRGAQGEAFPTIVASGPNSSLPHYEAGARRISENDILLIDWGAQVDWYRSDLTRVLWLGSIPPRLREIFKIVREAHDRGIDAVRPGVKAEDVDRAARQVIVKAGFGDQFNHALGHGIGVATHEAPRLGIGSTDELRPGMVVTIEPGVYLPGLGGVRIEDDVLVTATGHEVLTTLPVEFA